LRKQLRLHIGEVAASAEPAILETLLGSCVAVCLHDPTSRVGGMNHILLPGSCLSPRCGMEALELLLDKLRILGANRKSLVAKAFGGANVLPGFKSPTIGDENAEFVRRFLAAERIPLIAQRLGGNHAVQVKFTTDTGKAVVHTVDGSRLPKIVREENTYSSLISVDTLLSGDDVQT
jgi:chemotaxis protein CheD